MTTQPGDTSVLRVANANTVQISHITVRSQKHVESAELLVNKKPVVIQLQRTTDQTLKLTINPPLPLTSSQNAILRLQLPRTLRHPLKHREFRIDPQFLANVEDKDHEGEQERQQGDQNVDFTIRYSLIDGSGKDSSGGLSSTTSDIMRICPRFRILVIGKSGVGKSSLINLAFRVNEATVSKLKAGVSDINTEIISEDNDQFVLHDSQGFEPGEDNNFDIVRKFIEKRSAEPHVKDQIHAIWLCFGIPRTGGRIVETGIEKFLKMETRAPVIAVFTKYDMLVSSITRRMPDTKRQGLTPEAIAELAKQDAEAFIQKECVGPLAKEAKHEVPYTVVSTRKGHEPTLSALVQKTYDLVNQHVTLEASVVAAIAQRVNPSVNIEGSIAVGRMKYWKGLASSTCFPGMTLERCLDVIHDDIITVWSIEDPRNHLQHKKFKALMTNIVDEFSDRHGADPKLTMSAGMSAVATIAGIVAALGGPAAPITIPIAGCFVLAKWVYDVYQKSHDTLRRLMAYIIDLTLVMQNIFWFTTVNKRPVSRRLVKLAVRTYQDSTIMAETHESIRKHVEAQTVMDRMNRDDSLDEIEGLIKRNGIDTAKMFHEKDKIGKVDFLLEDESWDVGST